jgi:hypothetical protein
MSFDMKEDNFFFFWMAVVRSFLLFSWFLKCRVEEKEFFY